MNIFKFIFKIVFLYNIFKVIIIKMAEIAKNAFQSRNYRLAAEIYERCLKDNQTSLDLHFCYADSLAKCGNLREALDIYSYCYRKARLSNSPSNHNKSPEHLKHAISALLEAILSGPYKQQTSSAPSTKVLDNLVCGLCEDILNQPVTLICGHTVCRKCELKDVNRSCRRCGQQKQQQSLETNVLIKNLIEKWWPNLLNSAKLRDEGNEFFVKGDFDAALEKYNEAHNFAPENTLVLSNRSHVFLQMSRAQSALQDADHVTRLRPTWGKGHYRRGMALAALGRHEEALQALCSCVALDRNPHAVRHELAMVLHRLLLPSLRNRAHCGLSSSPQAPYWLGQSRLSSGTVGAVKGTFMRRSPTHPSPVRGACMRGGSSDCEDNSSGEEDMMLSQGSRSQSQQQLQSNSRLHGIIDRLFQTVDKMKRLDKPIEDSGLLQQVVGPVDTSDFDCVLCCRTLWRPVTTPCGHTYCWMCLDRCLDYSHACPLCMAPLADYLSSNQRSVTEFVDRALRALLPQEWSARQQLYHQELRAAEAEKDRTVAVFVCTTAFPAVPCPLFVYEPRYRLMIRRAVESGTKQFGIAACVDQHAIGHKRYAEYGTMLEIRDWLCMSNGCSILSTIGCRRFKVQEGGETDGYDLAKVEFLRDEVITPEQLLGIKRLHDSVRQKAQFWLSTLQPEPQAEINQTFGAMPALEEDWPSLADGPAWAWWLLAILPLGTKLKVGILGTTSLEKRLRAIDKTLDHLARQRMKSMMAARTTQEATRQQGSATQDQGSVNPSQVSAPEGQSSLQNA